MARFYERTSKSAGLPPGTPVHVGEEKAAKVRVTVIDYNESDLAEEEITDVERCAAFAGRPTVTWINVDGVHDVNIIQSMAEQFKLHPLVLEDIVNTTQRPKMEDYDDLSLIHI